MVRGANAVRLARHLPRRTGRRRWPGNL